MSRRPRPSGMRKPFKAPAAAAPVSKPSVTKVEMTNALIRKYNMWQNDDKGIRLQWINFWLKKQASGKYSRLTPQESLNNGVASVYDMESPPEKWYTDEALVVLEALGITFAGNARSTGKVLTKKQATERLDLLKRLAAADALEEAASEVLAEDAGMSPEDAKMQEVVENASDHVDDLTARAAELARRLERCEKQGETYFNKLLEAGQRQNRLLAENAELKRRLQGGPLVLDPSTLPPLKPDLIPGAARGGGGGPPPPPPPPSPSLTPAAVEAAGERAKAAIEPLSRGNLLAEIIAGRGKLALKTKKPLSNEQRQRTVQRAVDKIPERELADTNLQAQLFAAISKRRAAIGEDEVDPPAATSGTGKLPGYLGDDDDTTDSEWKSEDTDAEYRAAAQVRSRIATCISQQPNVTATAAQLRAQVGKGMSAEAFDRVLSFMAMAGELSEIQCNVYRQPSTAAPGFREELAIGGKYRGHRHRRRRRFIDPVMYRYIQNALDVCASCAEPAAGACICGQVRICSDDCLAHQWDVQGHGARCPGKRSV